MSDTPEQQPVNRIEMTAAAQERLLRVMARIDEARCEWVAECLKPLMPDELFEAIEAARRGEKRESKVLMRGTNWMEQHKVRLKVFDDDTELEVDGRVVGAFRVRMENGKWVTEKKLPQQQPPGNN